MSDSADWIYGIHAVGSAIKENAGRVRVVYLQRGRRDGRLRELRDMAQAAGVRTDMVDRRRLDQLCDGAHQGVVAQCHGLALANEADLEAALAHLKLPRLLLLLDGVTDPRNLGACLRSAAAAGVQAVLLPKRRSAPLSAGGRKTAGGGAESLLLVQVTNVARRLKWLQEQGLWVVGGSASGERPWREADLTGDVVLVVGSEDKGLRPLTAKCCDELVHIPMQGAVASLNVSVATGILLFEAVRQRAA